jgi:hypothetical protein
MRAKLINEEFKEESDPVKDMNIGYNNYKDYLKKELQGKDVDINSLMQWWFRSMAAHNSKEDILRILLEVMEETPIEYQIDWADDVLENYEYFKVKKI